jgi:hypothetical protein
MLDLQNWLEVSAQLYAPAALPSKKEAGRF